jgi:parallel beta-helix repeat protein
MRKKILILFILNILLISSSHLFSDVNINASGSIIYVDSNGEQDYTSIQDAIDDASNGDTIYVNSGIYTENIYINKSINLFGKGKGISIIDGNDRMNKYIIYLSTFNITIKNFTIKNGQIGINLKNSINITIKDNTIQQTDIGIKTDNSSNNTIYSNNFINNTENANDEYNNLWYNQDTTKGNYYDNHIKNDTNNDGIVDSPYNIPGGNNKDLYPLMQPITQKPYVSFIFSPITPTTQQTVQFNDTSYDIDGYITSWYWDFGDNTTSNLKNTSHRYIDNGVYTITLNTTDDLGATNQTKQHITVLNVKPEAKFIFTPDKPNDLQNISFNDTSVDVDGYISSWSWNFGDNNTSNLKNPNHRYNDDGIYTITFTVTDDDLATTTYTENIEIFNVKPSANFIFNPYKPTINDTVEFTDSSKDLDGTIVSWNWDLDDGTTSNQPTIKHRFNEGRRYRIKLTVVDDDGDSDTKIINIAVSDFSSNTPDYGGFIIVFIVFVVLFSIMIYFVLWIRKKEKQ